MSSHYKEQIEKILTMKSKKLFMTCALALLCVSVSAQYPIDDPKDELSRTKNLPTLKHLEMTQIPGAPILQQPVRIDGSKKEIRTGKHGLCYPAIYDWNHDGKPDLLLGEFATGQTGSNIKVYLNKGSKKKPKFTGEYFYALDAKGDTITNYQWCCIGIHPRFVDMDGDGYPELLSGQYNPGAVSMWKGSKDGFLPRVFIDQEGYKEGFLGGADPRNPDCFYYWNYTSASFADFNGDGLVDLFVGGCAGMRVALNEGTKEYPKFGVRNYLRFVDGDILVIDSTSAMKDGGFPTYMKTYMTPVDWDGDGVLDLLVTCEHDRKGDHAVLFYKGVNTNLGLRFKRPVPLFTVKDGSKEMPGCQPMIYVADVNGDGVNDIVMGLSVPTLHGEALTDLSWKWIRDLGIEMPGKDAGEYYMYSNKEDLLKRLHNEPAVRKYMLGNLDDEKYIDLRHRGYVYLFLGKKNPVKAEAEYATVKDPIAVETENFASAEQDEPLSYRIECEKKQYSAMLRIYLKFKDGWHGYANIPATTTMGMNPTIVSVEKSEGIKFGGEVMEPYVGNNPVLTGTNEYLLEVWAKDNKFEGKKLKIHVNYQACDEHKCLPPAEHIIEYVFK